jgi:rhodanese-related sulfurtransferase
MFKRNKGVDAPAAAELVAGGAVVVDVREQDEWDAGRIPGAVHVPLGELGERHSELPQGTRLVAVCRSGNRSGRATDTLRNLGFDVVNLDGGMKSWKANGLPMEPANGVVA